MPPTKAKLVNLYRKENDPKVKERLLLIIKVREDGQVPFHVVKDMHIEITLSFSLVKKI